MSTQLFEATVKVIFARSPDEDTNMKWVKELLQDNLDDGKIEIKSIGVVGTSL
jgi:hypothetical protein